MNASASEVLCVTILVVGSPGPASFWAAVLTVCFRFQTGPADLRGSPVPWWWWFTSVPFLVDVQCHGCSATVSLDGPLGLISSTCPGPSTLVTDIFMTLNWFSFLFDSKKVSAPSHIESVCLDCCVTQNRINIKKIYNFLGWDDIPQSPAHAANREASVAKCP